MSIKSKCPHCENKFEAVPNIETTEGVSVHFFSCTSCLRRFLIYVEDDEIKSALMKASVLSHQYQEETDTAKKSKLWNRLEKQKQTNRKLMRSKIEEHQDIINKIIEQ